MEVVRQTVLAEQFPELLHHSFREQVVEDVVKERDLAGAVFLSPHCKWPT